MLYPGLPGVLEAPMIATLLGSKRGFRLEISFTCLGKETHQLHFMDERINSQGLINIKVGDERGRVSVVDKRTEATCKGS